jgi:hypothetical protein
VAPHCGKELLQTKFGGDSETVPSYLASVLLKRIDDKGGWDDQIIKKWADEVLIQRGNMV